MAVGGERGAGRRAQVEVGWVTRIQTLNPRAGLLGGGQVRWDANQRLGVMLAIRLDDQHPI